MANSKVVEFKAYDGTKLVGDLYLVEAPQQPCIIMTNGFSGRRGHYLPDFANRFHAAGYNVLLYDHRNWGDSGGAPRHEVDPLLQTRDLFDAFNYAASVPHIGGVRIVYWGTSMAGGNVICAAAVNKNIRAVIAQVPFVSGENVWARTQAPTDMLLAERAGAIAQGKPALMPVFPASEEEIANGTSKAVLQDVGGMRFVEEQQRRGYEIDYYTTVQSLLYVGMHEPVRYIHRIAPTPLLMVVAETDVLIDSQEQIKMYEKAGEPKELHILKGQGHFDPYKGESFEESIGIQLKFLEKVLK